MIYLFGGQMVDANTHNVITDSNKQLYAFDTIKNMWTALVVTGTSAPPTRIDFQVAMDDSNRMYVFGGRPIGNSSISYNDMTIFDFNLLTWTQVNSSTPPIKRAGFTATYLPKNKLIIYIGGAEFREDGYL